MSLVDKRLCEWKTSSKSFWLAVKDGIGGFSSEGYCVRESPSHAAGVPEKSSSRRIEWLALNFSGSVPARRYWDVTLLMRGWCRL